MMEHRLTVQGTDEVYARTKKQMEIAVERRKEQRAQEIQVVPQGGECKKSDLLVVSSWLCVQVDALK